MIIKKPSRRTIKIKPSNYLLLLNRRWPVFVRGATFVLSVKLQLQFILLLHTNIYNNIYIYVLNSITNYIIFYITLRCMYVGIFMRIA